MYVPGAVEHVAPYAVERLHIVGGPIGAARDVVEKRCTKLRKLVELEDAWG